MPAILSDDDLPAGMEPIEFLTLVLQGLRDTDLVEGAAGDVGAAGQRLQARKAVHAALSRLGAPSPAPFEAEAAE